MLSRLLLLSVWFAPGLLFAAPATPERDGAKTGVTEARAEAPTYPKWSFSGSSRVGLSTSLLGAHQAQVAVSRALDHETALEAWGQTTHLQEGYQFDLGLRFNFATGTGRVLLGTRLRWDETVCENECGTASTMSETVQSFGFGLEGSLGQRWSAGPFFFGLEYAALFVPMYAGTGHRTARLSSRTYPNGRFEIDRETKVSRAPELRFMNIELGLRF